MAYLGNSLFQCRDNTAGDDQADSGIYRLHDDYITLLSHPHDVFSALSSPPIAQIAAAGAVSVAPESAIAAAPLMAVDAVDSSRVDVEPPSISRLVRYPQFTSDHF